MKEFYEKVAELAVSAGKYLLSQTVKVSSHKTKNDLLTENDLKTEHFIIEGIKKDFPSVNILSEEYNSENSLDIGGTTIIIDPIDGTCNFAVGLPLYGIQLAVANEGVCTFAAIYFPESDELITAEIGKGAYLNGKPLKVKNNASCKDGMLIISDYYDNISYDFSSQFELVKNLQKSYLKTRHFGAACVDFSYLARSHALAYITYYHKIWDIAPGLLVALEAGCVCASLEGGSYQYGNPGLVVANNAENLNVILAEYAALKEAENKA